MVFKSDKNKLDLNKGYSILKNKNDLDYLAHLSNLLSKTIIESKFNFFGIDKMHLKKCGMQFLVQHILGFNFNKSILIAIGNKDKLMRFGLPQSWLETLGKNKSLKAETLENKIKWVFTILKWYAHGNIIIINTFLKGFFKITKNTSRKNFIYFDDLTPKSVSNNFKNDSKTIIDWHLKNFNFNKYDIYHDVKERNPIEKNDVLVRYSEFPFRCKISRLGWISFLFQSFFVSIKVFLGFLKGDFLHALLLKEYPLIYLSKKANKNDFALKYLFHNSTWLFRPLWTYQAEKNGSEVILYYYSTNISKLKFNKDYLKDNFKKLMTWNNYYVWDSYQKNYLNQYLPEANFNIVGPIWFESSGKKLPNFDRKTKIVSIFDIQTYKEDFFQTLGVSDRYLTTKNMIKFQDDIFKVLSNINNIKVVLKRKRNIRKGFHDESYLNHLTQIYNNEKFIQISPNYSATSLIENSFLSINYPVTSTALIAKSFNINSIYYDPTGKVDPKDRALSGIKLVSGINELNKYIKEII